MTALDIERVALSNELLALAERFADESEQWADPACAEQLRHDAGLLATLGRAVLTNADIDTATAYADVARTAIGNVTGARMFLTGIRHKPTVVRR